MKQKFVAYFRVSSKKQGIKKLSLDSQKKQIENYCKGKGVVIESFTEVESGKKDKRIELDKAIQCCKDENAILVIAKLDRLSRNLTFISSLMDSNLEFICCDMPTATKFTIHIFAALAQQEHHFISTRTKEALAEKKARGEKLGTPKNLDEDAKQKGLSVRTQNADNHIATRQALYVIQQEKEKDKTYQQIANILNDLEYKTRRGKSFSASTVHRIYTRFLKQEQSKKE